MIVAFRFAIRIGSDFDRVMANIRGFCSRRLDLPEAERPTMRALVDAWQQRHRDVFFQLWRAELFPPLVEPIVMFLALGLGLGTYVELTGDTDYIQFLAPGVLVIFPMFAAVFESLWGAYWRLDRQGTYAAILATPARPEEIVAGDILWAATRMLLNSVLILVVMAVLTAPWDLIGSPLVIFALPVNLLSGILFAS